MGDIKEFKEPLKSGTFNGVEYIGSVFKQGDKFLGQINEVPDANRTEPFLDFDAEYFDDYESAVDYVNNQWEKKFGK